MKLSKKLKTKIKKIVLLTLVVVALVTTTLAIFKLADFSMPFNNQTNLLAGKENAKSLSENRLENTDTITYIYDADDLVAFRDAVNAGDNYSGKTVYLMDDIDLSTVCSSELGSWNPIGATGTYFAGTFDGNYHNISNLYYSGNSYANVGLFSCTVSSTIIQNLVLKNVYINNIYKSSAINTGALVANMGGKIQNCGIDGGTVIGNSSAGSYLSAVAGIAGRINTSYAGKIINCYNKASITATAKTSGSGYTYAGGVAGYASYVNGEQIVNCYNTGKIYAKGQQSNVGGVIGYVAKSSGASTSITLKNLYNIGSVSGGNNNKVGGIIGANGYSGTSASITLTNSYCTTSTSYLYQGASSSTGNRVAAETLKTYLVKLGNAYVYDIYNKNSGYPVLAWQNETVVMNLNRNQAYIGVGEKLALNVVEDDKVTEIIGDNYVATNFVWSSTNKDVATVNENGIVTGVADGYTTVYAYHEASGMYAMCVVNVAKGVANPQIETGNGFTVILKADGTVWTIGNNTSGQLGNGTTENSKIPTKVYIDEDTALSNVIKIAVGTDHVLALTKDGKVYGWGANSNGQLGQNNTESLTYAKLVLSENGTSYLSNIVDISANGYGSIALNKNGNVYVWGRGTTGEIGNNATTSSNLPIKNKIENAIQVSIGDGHVGVLTSEGVVWSWGQNTAGQLGINCANNTSYPMKTALNVTELSVGGYHTTVKKIDGTLYASRSI